MRDSIVVPVRIGSAPSLFANGPEYPDLAASERFARAEFKLDKIAESLWQQMIHVEDHGYHPKHILLGRDFYGQFIKGCTNDSYFSFNVPMDYRAPIRPSTFETMFCGLKLHCIPWMEGAVVVPHLSNGSDWKPPTGWEPLELQAPDASTAERMIAYLRKSFKEYAEKPLPKSKFVRTKRLLWWWY